MLRFIHDLSYRLLPVQYRFSRIYKKNRWGSNESRSGDGSTLENTANLRRFMEKIISDWNIESIVDIACGDFNWMSGIVENNNVNYLGIDIVPNLIEENKRKYESNRVKFKISNVIDEVPPKAHLAVFRDCMLHLSFADGLLALKNIKSSGSPIVLMSTWTGTSKNLDIISGRFRPVDMRLSPFNLPEPIQIIKENEQGKYIGLWKTSDL